MKKTGIIILLLSLLPAYCLSQEDDKPVVVSGYATWLHSAIFDSVSGPWISNSMLHNRINVRAYAGGKVTLGMDVRNRFITGDTLALDMFYRESVDDDPGWADLSWNMLSETSFILNTMIDRLWIDLTFGNLQITAGRQRINWSQTLVWNPNDIFNTYSFFDFDYIERPGSDAVRAVYSVTPSSAAELAVKAGKNGAVTAAALYRFSLFNADIQFLAGETEEDTFVAGTGWSGYIGSFAFRGEASWFLPLKNNSSEEGSLIITVGSDHSFSDKVSAVAQVMYCNNPLRLNLFTELYSGGLKASQLAFSKVTAFGQLTVTPVPLLNISASAIWYPDLDGFFAGPSIDFSAAENIDFSLIWQYFNSMIGGEKTRMNLGYIRIKYSF